MLNRKRLEELVEKKTYHPSSGERYEKEITASELLDCMDEPEGDFFCMGGKCITTTGKIYVDELKQCQGCGAKKAKFCSCKKNEPIKSGADCLCGCNILHSTVLVGEGKTPRRFDFNDWLMENNCSKKELWLIQNCLGRLYHNKSVDAKQAFKAWDIMPTDKKIDFNTWFSRHACNQEELWKLQNCLQDLYGDDNAKQATEAWLPEPPEDLVEYKPDDEPEEKICSQDRICSKCYKRFTMHARDDGNCTALGIDNNTLCGDCIGKKKEPKGICHCECDCPSCPVHEPECEPDKNEWYHDYLCRKVEAMRNICKAKDKRIKELEKKEPKECSCVYPDACNFCNDCITKNNFLLKSLENRDGRIKELEDELAYLKERDNK